VKPLLFTHFHLIFLFFDEISEHLILGVIVVVSNSD